MVNKAASQRHIYGLTLLGRFKSIKMRKGRDGVAEVIRGMREDGYRGPIHMGDVSRTKKYLFSDYLLCLKRYRQKYGRKEFYAMSAKASMFSETLGLYEKITKKPGVLLKRSNKYWQKFFDFGELVGVPKGSKVGEITGRDVCIEDKVFCSSITKYLEGAGDVIDVDVKSRHTKCKLRGDDISKWEVKW